MDRGTMDSVKIKVWSKSQYNKSNMQFQQLWCTLITNESYWYWGKNTVPLTHFILLISFDTPENVRKPLVFWYFQWVSKVISGMKWVKIPYDSVTICNHNHNRSSHRRCSIKKLYLKISQNSRENTCVGVSFYPESLF